MVGLVDLIFFLLVAVTIVGALWLSRKFKERYAEFPWWKAAVLIVIEVVAWIITHKFVAWIQRHIWIVPIVIVIAIVVIIAGRKKKERII